MTLRESVINAIQEKFKNTQFLRKDMIDRYIRDHCPTIQNFSIEHSEPLASYILIHYDDGDIKGKMLWRKGSNGVSYVLCKTELVA